MTRRGSIDRRAIRDAVDHTHAPIAVAIAPFFFGDVDRAARRAFARLGSGVLVFVVPARGQVVVLADEDTRTAADGMLWHDVAAHIARAFAHGRGTRGIVEGVELLARALQEPFDHRDSAGPDLQQPFA